MEKRKRNKNKIKQQDTGITLIALVITVIIIIILATVTINFAFGDNGLIKKAEEAKGLMTNDMSHEQGLMQNMADYMNEFIAGMNGGGEEEPDEPEEDTTAPIVTIQEGEVTENSISINVIASDPESGLANENAYVYYLNGSEYTRGNSSSCTFNGLNAETAYTIKVEVTNGIGLKGEDSTTITTEAKPGISAEEIQQNPSSYYGAEIKGYTCSSSGVSKWRIFYADASNIYIIADDYISGANAPKSAGNHSVNSSGEKICFTDIVDNNDYSTGGSWIQNNRKAKRWLNKYLSSSYGTSTNANMKAVAYLMDTNVWDSYAGSQAEYAIGGPTLELFCASYKDTHPSRYLECDSVTSTGYQLKWSDGSYSNYVSGLTQDDFNSIYIKSDTSKADGMWLASPSAHHANNLMRADSTGYVYSNSYNWYGLGLRPLVCLKSSVQLEAVDGNTYRIAN